jgi:biotin carboxylase
MVHVQSTQQIYFGARTFRPDDFVANIIFDGDLAKLAQAVRRFRPSAVIAGVQTGVALADSLSEALGLPSNGSARSRERIDKFEMFRVLSEHGLACARSHASADVEALVDWFRAQGGARAIVKPCTSAGTDHVTICSSEDEVRAAFAAIVNQRNRMGLINRAAIIQELLEGTEYIVNTVSYKGRHHVTDVWRYGKVQVNGASFVYDRCELLDSTEEPAPALCAYTSRVLDAFGMQEGPSHNELMLTARGPALIEINPRMAGAQIPRMAAIGIGEGQLEWTAKAYLEREQTPAGFGAPYRRRRHALLCPLISHVEGRFRGLAFGPELAELRSFQFADYFVEPGQRIARTVDCYTQPGIVFLAHDDAAVVSADHARVRELEQTGLYQIETSAGGEQP